MDEAGNVWDDVPEWGGGVGARRLVRDPAGSLNASVWELAPGAGQMLYHFHHASQELLVVLRGTPTVRLHDGDRALREGDVVPLPPGPRGGHAVRNEGPGAARVLIVAANADPDITEYPDTGKVGVYRDGTYRFHRVADAVDNAFPDT